MKKLSLLVGLGAGYVLGAKAGKERYNEIMRKVDELRGRPEVQRATDKLSTTATDLASTAKEKASATAAKVQHKDPEKTVDLTSPSSMAGATSATAPSTAPPTTPSASPDISRL